MSWWGPSPFDEVVGKKRKDLIEKINLLTLIKQKKQLPSYYLEVKKTLS